MKYWTFQTTSRADALRSDVGVFPQWNATGYRIVGSSMEAYQYLLEQFNRKNGTNANGLIFGYVQPSKDAVYEAIVKAGAPSGSYFPAATHKLLELDVPDETAIITVDFYRFSDLLYACGESDELLTPEVAKRDLLKPNGAIWELPVTHIEGICPEWLVADHIPKEFF